MQNPLSERCFKAINQNVMTSDYLKVLKVLLVENQYSSNDVQMLLNRLFGQSIPPEADILPIIKEFVAVLLLLRFEKKNSFNQNEVISKFLVKMINHPNSYDDSLVISYLSLISALIGRSADCYQLKSLPSGFVTVGVREISIYGEQIILRNQIEIALNLLLISLLTNSKDFFYQALKIIQAVNHCLDENGEIIIGIWSSANLEDRESIASLAFLASYIIDQIAGHKPLSKLLQLQSQVVRNIADDNILNIGFYPLILSFAIDQILNTELHDLIHEIKFSDFKENLFSEVGFVYDRFGYFTTYLILSGINRSIGSILTDDVQIIAMGPHFSPLGDLSKFGNFQTANTEYSMPLTYEKNEGMTLIKGMTKIVQSDSTILGVHPSNTWIDLEIVNTNNLLKLTISLAGEPCKLPLYFVFFVKSPETETIGNQLVKPRSLDKYVGPATRVVFKGMKKKFTITPSFEEKMHLIPLEGKSHFWGADYLLACEISHFQKKYIWEFQ